MRDFSKRRSAGATRRFMLQLAGALLLLVVAAGMVRAAWGMYGKFAEAAQSDALSQKKLADLKTQEAQISGSVQDLTTARGIEQEVRERYGVAKPGEGQIQIVSDSAASTTPPPQGPGVFMRVWQALFGWI